jgi:serpin B
MDYAGKLYSMNILLPKSPDKLPALEKAFNPGYFSELENMSKWQGVDVYLPRFTFSSSFSLKAILSAAGMSDAFDDNADFSGMTGKKNLMIDNILHKAFIEVNEKGTEAAASTAVVMMERAALPEEKSEFKADHPFFFYIKNNESGAITVYGKMMNPKQ